MGLAIPLAAYIVGMNPTLPAVLLCFCAVAAHGQIIGKSVPEYTTKRGTVIHKGDTLHFGLGTDINGLFKYAAVPPNFMGTPKMPFTANYANTTLVIKDLRLQNMNKRMAPRTLAVVNASGGLNAAVDLDAAEEAGEIKTANNKAQLPVTSAPAGVADELLKLKKLLDGGVITQQEFDAQKAKLLSK